ncbi:hypothetical protein KIPB_016838, partial [Kipferlia bialata]|eukprot:g16838.t1
MYTVICTVCPDGLARHDIEYLLHTAETINGIALGEGTSMDGQKAQGIDLMPVCRPALVVMLHCPPE